MGKEMRTRIALQLLTAMILGLAPGGATQAGEPARERREGSQGEAASALEQSLAELFPRISQRLESRATFEEATVEAAGSRFSGLRPVPSLEDLALPDRLTASEAEAWLDMVRRGDGTAFDSLFPGVYTSSFVVQAGGIRVALRALGASTARALDTNGKVIYQDAYPETDVLYTVQPGRVEEFLFLRSPSAPIRFEYEIGSLAGATRVFLHEGSVRFTDDRGQGLEIEKPWVIDAEGRQPESAARWALGPERRRGSRRLTLHVDPTGLTYPLLVDPSWRVTGSMISARGRHSATLLPNGKVLVAAGAPTTLTTAELYDPATGAFTATGSLAFGRTWHSATLLRNGKVLLAGGATTGGGTTANCVLYDAATGTWTATGSLSLARQGHTGTLLKDGRVLVAGGYSVTGTALNSTAIYNPATGTWTATGSMNQARRGHTASLLGDGRVLVAGGYNPIVLATAEIYNPATGTWTQTLNNMSNIRSDHSATLLPDGRLLVVGEFPLSANNRKCDLFDPATGLWSATGNLNVGRGGHTASLLPNGKVLVAGGSAGSYHRSTEVYDPGTGTWTVSVDLNTGRGDHVATLLPDGNILVTGGFNAGALTSAELFDSSAGNWTTTAPLSFARDLHTSTLLPNGLVLAAGGGTAGATAELYNPGSGTWAGTGNLNTGRYGHSATLLTSGKVVVAGGFGTVSHLDSAELYDPGTGTWSTTGSMNTARSTHTATLLADGRVLVAGGFNGSYLASSELFDPATGVWTTTGSLNFARSDHPATLLPDGRVLVVGGYDGVSPLASAEVYDPATGIWSLTGSLTTARRLHSATFLPSGRVLVAAGFNGAPVGSAELYNPSAGTWSGTGSLSTGRHSHTATLLPDARVLVSGGWNGTALASAENYLPALGTWISTGTLNTARFAHRATLLGNGKVLTLGGLDVIPLSTSSAELYDVGLGYVDAWRPVLASATDPLLQGASLLATGTGFQGISEASGGEEVNSSTNYPLIQLRRLDSESIRWLPVSAAPGWSDTSFTSVALTGLQPGHALVTVFTNGIPSLSRIITVECPAAIITAQPTSQSVCQAGTAVFTVGAAGTCLAYGWRKNGSPLTDGGHYAGAATDTLTVSPVDAADAASYDVLVSEPCSNSTTVSTSATLSFSVLPPSFAGLASVSPIGGTCGFRLEWSPAAASCPSAPSVRYNVYRSETPGFTPGPANLIQSCVSYNFFNDTAGIVSGTTYYYVVRAEDSAAGFGGLCNGGIEETNTVEQSGVIAGSCNPSNLPTDVRVLTVTSTDQKNKIEWLNPNIGPYGFTRVVFRDDLFPAGPNDGTVLGDLFASPGSHDSIEHTNLNNGTTYYYAAFVNNGVGAGTFAAGRFTRGRPFDNTVTPVKWAYSTGATTMAPPGIGPAVYSGSNDRILHAMERGATGGDWPGGWTPLVLNEPAPSRPPVVPTSLIAGATRVAFLGSQDGRVYAVNADTGQQLWQSPLLGEMVQAAPAGMFTAFGGAYNCILVGTRSSTSDNVFYALNVADGTVVGTPFNNGGGATAIGVISGQAYVDYGATRVYFTSRTAGSANSVWCLKLTATGLDPVPVWTRALGDIDGSPVLRNGRVYVGTNLGVVHSLDAANGNTLWSYSTGDGAVKGFIFTDRFSNALYLSTTSQVWGLTDGSPTPNWPAVSLPGPSTPLFTTGGTYLFVGASDGQLYQLDLSTNPPTVTSATLGDGLAAVGSPSLDIQNGLVYVGTDAGIVYAVAKPIP